MTTKNQPLYDAQSIIQHFLEFSCPNSLEMMSPLQVNVNKVKNCLHQSNLKHKFSLHVGQGTLLHKNYFILTDHWEEVFSLY